MGDFDRLPKKEASRLEDELERLNRLLGGMRGRYRLPEAIFIVDPHREEIAVAEAQRTEIPIVAMVDTNCNPDVIDHPIPANDDAIRAIRLLASKIAEAVVEGRQQRESVASDGEAAEFDGEGDEESEKAVALGTDFLPSEWVEGGPATSAADTEPETTASTDVAPAPVLETSAAESATAPEPAATAQSSDEPTAAVPTSPAEQNGSGEAAEPAVERPATTAYGSESEKK
jgi:small subunit ribosomal protein S2